jgi:hypothetical protein
VSTLKPPVTLKGRGPRPGNPETSVGAFGASPSVGSARSVFDAQTAIARTARRRKVFAFGIIETSNSKSFLTLQSRVKTSRAQIKSTRQCVCRSKMFGIPKYNK